jgi:uncharacterized protein (DUF2062 family)
MTLAPIVVDVTLGVLILAAIGFALSVVVATVWTMLVERRQRRRVR